MHNKAISYVYYQYAFQFFLFHQWTFQITPSVALLLLFHLYKINILNKLNAYFIVVALISKNNQYIILEVFCNIIDKGGYWPSTGS